MAEIVYVACALLSIICAVMLFRHYRVSKSQLLLWSCFCFIGLAANNVLLFLDMVVFPDVDFSGHFLRNALSAASGSLLLYGLIRELT